MANLLYGMKIEVWVEDDKEGAKIYRKYGDGGRVIKLAYRSGLHYDAIVNIEGEERQTQVIEEEVVEIKKSQRKNISKDDETNATVGRIRLTIELGQTSRSRKANIRVINRCQNGQELKEKMQQLNIWSVEITERPTEDIVNPDGYCGYVSITQALNGIRRYNLRDRVDRIEVGMVIRNLINGSDGVVREGFRSFNLSDLNAKERAEMAYAKIMRDGNFLSHLGLETEYWLRGWMYEKRCDEFKLFSWGKIDVEK